jgi:Na+/H+-dicarboxylate symporter
MYICKFIYIYIYIYIYKYFYSTAFNTNVIPKGFAYLVAITWLQGRMMTIVNVTGDCIVARVVTEWTKNDGVQEFEKIKTSSCQLGSEKTDLNLTAHDELPGVKGGLLRSEA